MKIKIQILSIYGGVLFEFEKENNTQRETILEAVNSRANLYGANLSGANLSGADLSGADLLDTFIQPHCTWVVGIKNDLIKIGCKEKSIEDWDIWFSGTEEYSTKRGTKDFAKIQAMYISLKAYTNFLKDFNEITK